MKSLIFGCLAGVIIPQAMAALPYGPTAAEVATLPAFCRAKLGDVSQAEKMAAERSLGAKNWLHFHHYCYAVNFMKNRLSSVQTSSERKSMLNVIIGNYEYVLKHAENTFWMRPQIHLEIGRVYERMREKGAAMGQYGQAISFNPDFQAAYLPLIAVQRDLGDPKSALATASEGLRRFPSSTGLKKAYLSLGGKEPFPEPIMKKAAVPRDAKPQASAVTTNEDRQGSEASVESKSAVKPASDVQAESVDEEAIRGCRFCPPDEIQQRWRDSFDEAQKP